MNLTRLSRPLGTMALLLALSSGFASTPALAQEPPPVEGEGSGRSLDGYFATAAIAGLVLFIVCKSARRS
jgi:hypothetical protein